MDRRRNVHREPPDSGHRPHDRHRHGGVCRGTTHLRTDARRPRLVLGYELPPRAWRRDDNRPAHAGSRDILRGPSALGRQAPTAWSRARMAARRRAPHRCSGLRPVVFGDLRQLRPSNTNRGDLCATRSSVGSPLAPARSPRCSVPVSRSGSEAARRVDRIWGGGVGGDGEGGRNREGARAQGRWMKVRELGTRNHVPGRSDGVARRSSGGLPTQIHCFVPLRPQAPLRSLSLTAEGPLRTPAAWGT